ncbi:MAG TPA: beta-ketoacyl synthase N-terminal-like domain-containing protein [Patescibacteria group bacterium]|nr:beta-ketoacyl synthase N-terminal-like domain-containing protein [Gammaproteobacteria bacterium]HWA51508.1 beta-ketoacyl synthase N-terminal-like domain-containing protein [Patescibacteria group bacterium]
MKTTEQNFLESDIAIVGMSGRFPGAKNINLFWKMLCNGTEGLEQVSLSDLKNSGIPDEYITHKDYVRVCGVLPEYDQFDAGFFGYSSEEAMMLDPQYRIFLEESWSALENAGYNPENYSGKIGVFAGCKHNPISYLNFLLQSDSSQELSPFEVGVLAETSQLATRVSYELNLTGPSIQIQTACSTSLVAIHLACMSLLNNDCDMALAGGITLLLPPAVGYLYKEGLVYSPDGKCRAFDKNASGTVMTSGVGIIVLKRLQDALSEGDHIEAIIKSTAVNNDGRRKIGFTAPSISGQVEAIRTAISLAQVPIETITHIEAHGTGTIIGDPIEVSALTQAFRAYTQKNNFCTLGSIKSNIGHLDVAAGVAGVIKVVLALKHKTLPASINFSEPNPNIDFECSPFYMNLTTTDWEKQDSHIPYRAAVNSLGVGGTNAHLIMEEAPGIKKLKPNTRSKIICISAKSVNSLNKNFSNLLDYFLDHKFDNLDDVAFTLQVGRKHFQNRICIICKDIEDAIEKIAKEEFMINTKKNVPNFRKITFVLSNVKSVNIKNIETMMRDHLFYKSSIENCLNILKNMNINIDIQDSFSPLAKFVGEYALACFLIGLNIIPEKMIAVGFGECLAACLTGVISLSNALNLVNILSCFKKNNSSLEHFSMEFAKFKFADSKDTWISKKLNRKVSISEIKDYSYWYNQVLNDSSIELEDSQLSESVAIDLMEQINNGTVLSTIAKLYIENVDINFAALHFQEIRNRLLLPTYEFDRKILWPKLKQNNTPGLPISMPKRFSVDKQFSAQEISEQLNEIWLSIFDEKNLNLQSSFLGLGGNSLRALRMIEKINRTFTLELPVTWVYFNDNVLKQTHELARILELNNNEQVSRSNYLPQGIIAFNQMPSVSPLFLVHPSQAGAEVYYNLAKKLKDTFSVYGIESHNLNCMPSECIDSLELLASHYINKLKEIQPRGEYVLGGWSMGGVIAYEMAKQLIKQGDKVINLYLLDSAVTILCPEEIYHAAIPEMIKLIPENILPTSYGRRLQELIPRELEMLARYNKYEEYTPPATLFKANKLIRKHNVNMHNDEWVDCNRLYELLLTEDSNGWKKYMKNLTVVNLACSHETILSNDALGVIVEHIMQDIKVGS